VACLVTLLGGESTGKSTLANALCEQLNGNGVRTAVVPEHLRQWCAAHGRVPHADEQAELAQMQAQWIDEATALQDLQVVVADTTPLVIAAYSELYFGDSGLLAKALQWQRRADLTLLMGLDLAWAPDGLFRDSAARREATDAVLRRELQAAAIAFHTVYGHGAARMRPALRLIGRVMQRALGEVDAHGAPGPRPWSCEACGDVGCEQRLFTALLPRRSTEEKFP
jgi:nicotinamide riboside kinase